MSCTKLIFNPICEAAVEVKKSLTVSMESPSQGLSQLKETAKISLEEEFLELTPRNTILGLNSQKEPATFVVFGTVKEINSGSPWWYTACMCSKAVFPYSNMYFCEKCYKHVLTVFPRYCVKVRVHDGTGNAIFVIFDRNGAFLFNKTAVELFEIEDKVSGNHALPKEISDLVGKFYLFKVEYKPQKNSQFEQSFRVKKICVDEAIIQKFKDGCCQSCCVTVGKGKELVTEDSSIDISHDLMPKFTYAAVQGSSQIEGKVVGEESSQMSNANIVTPAKKDPIFVDLEITPPMSVSASSASASQIPIDLYNDFDNLTPLKRESPTETNIDADLHAPPKMLKKNIKIEKD